MNLLVFWYQCIHNSVHLFEKRLLVVFVARGRLAVSVPIKRNHAERSRRQALGHAALLKLFLASTGSMHQQDCGSGAGIPNVNRCIAVRRRYCHFFRRWCLVVVQTCVGMSGVVWRQLNIMLWTLRLSAATRCSSAAFAKVPHGHRRDDREARRSEEYNLHAELFESGGGRSRCVAPLLSCHRSLASTLPTKKNVDIDLFRVQFMQARRVSRPMSHTAFLLNKWSCWLSIGDAGAMNFFVGKREQNAASAPHSAATKIKQRLLLSPERWM